VNTENQNRIQKQNSLIAIVACTPSGVIGLNGAMPWKLASDLRRFKSMTMGGTLVMGRKTYDSIGKPLPGRETIVLSRSASQGEKAEHLHWFDSAEAVLLLANELGKPVYIVGGAEIYKIFFPLCDEIWLTRVWSSVQGDTRIQLPLGDFTVFEQSRHPQTARDSVPTEFQKLRRKNSVPKF
jgi:dihydrofolate reductase